MAPNERPLTAEDLAAIAAMHCACLPTSLPAVLGRGYVQHLYRYAVASATEVVFTEWRDSTLAGVCVLTAAPATLGRRLLLRTPVLAFAPPAVGRIVRSLDWRFRSGSAATLALGPEVVWLFTNPAIRRQGVAATLLRRVERHLAGQGVPQYRVQTEAGNRDALAFYAQQGFRRAGQRAAPKVTLDKPVPRD